MDNFCVLKIYASSTDKIGSELLYEHVVYAAKTFGIQGVTVYRGLMGFGESGKINSTRYWELTEKLPIVIEIVDGIEKVKTFFERIKNELNEMPKGCLVTIEPVNVLLNKSGKK